MVLITRLTHMLMVYILEGSSLEYQYQLVTHRSATLIDHLLTSPSSSGIMINDVTDHFAIFHISTTTPKKTKPQIKHIRSFSKENISTFKSELDRINFSTIDCPYSKKYKLTQTAI